MTAVMYNWCQMGSTRCLSHRLVGLMLCGASADVGEAHTWPFLVSQLATGIFCLYLLICLQSVDNLPWVGHARHSHAVVSPWELTVLSEGAGNRNLKKNMYLQVWRWVNSEISLRKRDARESVGNNALWVTGRKKGMEWIVTLTMELMVEVPTATWRWPYRMTEEW